MEVSGQLHDPAALTPEKDPPPRGGWVDPSAVLDEVVKRKIPSLRSNIIILSHSIEVNIASLNSL